MNLSQLNRHQGSKTQSCLKSRTKVSMSFRPCLCRSGCAQAGLCRNLVEYCWIGIAESR